MKILKIKQAAKDESLPHRSWYISDLITFNYASIVVFISTKQFPQHIPIFYLHKPLHTHLIYCDGCHTAELRHKVFWQHVMACLDSFWSWSLLDSLRSVFRFASCSSILAVYKSNVDVYLRITVLMLLCWEKSCINPGKTFIVKHKKLGMLQKLKEAPVKTPLRSPKMIYPIKAANCCPVWNDLT